MGALESSHRFTKLQPLLAPRPPDPYSITYRESAELATRWWESMAAGASSVSVGAGAGEGRGKVVHIEAEAAVGEEGTVEGEVCRRWKKMAEDDDERLGFTPSRLPCKILVFG